MHDSVFNRNRKVGEIMKKETIHVFSAMEHTLQQMPKYNPHAVGHGIIRSGKYKTRQQRKAEVRKMVREVE